MVGLEGKEYESWPIARLIERELLDPLFLTEYRVKVKRPEAVTVCWNRDAWQAAIRVRIKESCIAPTPITLDRLDTGGWAQALECAKECLDPRRNYRGRRRTDVTLLRSGRIVERQVSPHLQFKTRLAECTPEAMKVAKKNLEALHAFATNQARP